MKKKKNVRNLFGGIYGPVHSPSYDQMQLQYFDLTLCYLERVFLDIVG